MPASRPCQAVSRWRHDQVGAAFAEASFSALTRIRGGRESYVDDRGALALPAAVRRMSGIAIGPPVVLVAAVPEQTVLIHPATTVTRLLAAHYRTLIGTHDAR